MTQEPTDVLVRAALRAAADEVVAEAELVPDPVAAVEARVRANRARSRRRVVVAAAAAVVVLAAGVGLVLSGGDDTSEGVVVTEPPTTEGVPGTSTTAPSEPDVDAGDVAPSPLAYREDPAVAAADGRVVVWGGFPGEDGEPFADGALYDVATDTWTQLPPAPSTLDQEAAPVLAIGADGVVVVARGSTAARWVPGDTTWSELAAPPAPIGELTAVGDGRMVSASGHAVLDTAQGTWTDLGLAGFDLSDTAQAWTGEELVVVGPSPDGTPGRAYALTVDPVTATWGEEIALPPGELLADGGLAAAWDGAQVLVVDREGTAATYDPTQNTWTLLPPLPARPDGLAPRIRVAGPVTAVDVRGTTALRQPGGWWLPAQSLLAASAAGAVVDPPPGPTGRVAVWVADASSDTSGLEVIDLVGVTQSPDRRIRVGAAAIPLVGDDLVTAARVGTGADDLPVGAIEITLTADEGGVCTVVDAEGAPRLLDPATARTEMLPADDPASEQGGSDERPWAVDPTGQTLETEAYDSVVVRISCDDPIASHRLAVSAQLGLPD